MRVESDSLCEQMQTAKKSHRMLHKTESKIQALLQDKLKKERAELSVATASSSRHKVVTNTIPTQTKPPSIKKTTDCETLTPVQEELLSPGVGVTPGAPAAAGDASDIRHRTTAR